MRQTPVNKKTPLWFVILFLCFLFIPEGAMSQEPGQAGNEQAPGTEQWQVLATSPGVKVVAEQQKEPGQILPSGEPPKDAAYNWLAEKGLEEGRNIFGGKLLYISVGSASVNATPQHRDYIDSRYLAFQRAELEAKAKTAIYLGVDLTTERGSAEREISPAERAALNRIYSESAGIQRSAEECGVSDQISLLFDKAGRLSEAKLDQALRESGVDPDKEGLRKKARDEARRDRMQSLRSISEASVKASAAAFTEVQGTQVIQAFEGSYHGNYQVVVITLWSKNLERLVKMMTNGGAPMPLPKKRAKEAVLRQLPEKDQELACLTGVRAYINQRGEHVLLAFGQAGVEVIGGRADKAFERADHEARLRAVAALRSFMGERVAFTANEELREVLALYAKDYGEGGGEQEYHAISNFNQMIEAKASEQRITGVYSVYSKELEHPFTDRPMVLKVMAWSPESQAMAQDVKRMIEPKHIEAPRQTEHRKGQQQTPARKGTISSGEGADADAW
jgi:hypothetical protein